MNTYKQQFDKITEAYIAGDIQPFDTKFCFCGTLAGGQLWESKDYSTGDFTRMEEALLRSFEPIGLIYLGLRNCRAKGGGFIDETIRTNPLYEDYLFAGMCAALEVLKQIHIELGEIIDETPVFVKRQLITNA